MVEKARMMAVAKWAGTARLKAELEQTIEEEKLQEFTRVYTDGSVMEDPVGYLVICGNEKIQIRLAEQTCIFNDEAQAILEAIKGTRRWRIVNRILITDSLSNVMAQETLYSIHQRK
jgi:hypothetical protein